VCIPGNEKFAILLGLAKTPLISPFCPTISSTDNEHKVSFGIMSAFQNGGAPARVMDDESDVEEEALVADYQEQIQYEDGMDELEQTMSMAQQTGDIQSRLAAAAQPLDFSASLEVKFASYDNYCSLFHFILNSDGPVDLEPPSVCSLCNI
jgi:hypothetical protein